MRPPPTSHKAVASFKLLLASFPSAVLTVTPVTDNELRRWMACLAELEIRAHTKPVADSVLRSVRTRAEVFLANSRDSYKCVEGGIIVSAVQGNPIAPRCKAHLFHN
ncbi:hypothetical protein AVEN_194569-1 [Araneus ventricosus]|uniref:PH domain-containing protein n=1 Tax=Araneus ventricosus TaxID=182803 RepID=A0A4Y2A6E6_ARAVE|nr:hypothetical protein AVEN_194569-1 [Araneus ventricosus]